MAAGEEGNENKLERVKAGRMMKGRRGKGQQSQREDGEQDNCLFQ